MAARGPRKWRPTAPVWLGPAVAAACPAAVLAVLARQSVPWPVASGVGLSAAAAAAWLAGRAARPLVRDREVARQAREKVQQLLDGTRRQAAAIATQRAELRRTNQRLQRSDRYKNEFLANMTHELRSPLNSMLLLSQVLAENRAGRLAADEVDAAQVINQAGRELLVIIDDILDLTKAEAGRLELHPATVELADLAESLAGLYRPLAARRGLQFSVSVAPDTPPTCHTDPTRLSQILKNLLNNALKFTERGSVELRIGPAAETVRGQPAVEFVVADTGIGINPDNLPSLFAPFTQADGSISRRFGGSGLGLSICRKLTELLGARVAVASEPGRGSTFSLRLPLRAAGGAGPADAEPIVTFTPAATPAAAPREAAAPATRRAAPAAEVAGILGGLPVLLVDADMRAVYLLSSLLQAAGARVDVAREARAALSRLHVSPVPRLALVEPSLIRGLPAGERADWWRRAAAGGARVVALAAPGAAVCDVPAGVPALDPGLADAAFCRALGGLAAAAVPGRRQEVAS